MRPEKINPGTAATARGEDTAESTIDRLQFTPQAPGGQRVRAKMPPLSFCSGYGQWHSPNNNRSPRPYIGVCMDEIRALLETPQLQSKENAQWVIFSTLKSRVHEEQRNKGSFYALWADIDDTGGLEFSDTVSRAARALSCNVLAYTSRSATADNQKCRLILPLAGPVPGSQFILMQKVLNERLKAADLVPDIATERAGQLCYLPNKGEFYAFNIEDAPGPLSPSAWSGEVAVQQEAEKARQQAQEAARAAAGLKVQQRVARGGESPIDAFNAAYGLPLLLDSFGYLKKGARWLSPNSSSNVPGVSVTEDGSKWLSTHASDSEIGRPTNNGTMGDAFDLFVYYQHGGDRGAAIKAAGATFTATDGLTITQANQRAYMEAQGAEDAPGHLTPEPFELAIPPIPWPDDCLPPEMNEAAQAIAEHAAAPEAMAGMAVLAAVAHIVMRLIDALHPKTGRIPASLYILIKGLSGDRKTECFKLATRPIAERERALREEHKAQTQRLEQEAAQAKPKEREAILQKAPPNPRTIFTDVTTEKIEQSFIRGSAPALSLSTDEGGTLLSGHSLKAETRAASLSALTRLYDGSGVQRDRVGDGQSGFRYGVRFGLFLSAQPVVLREVLSDPLMRGQGFLPRFLYTAPASLAGTRFLDWEALSRKAHADPRIARYWGVLRRMDGIDVNTDEHGGLCLPTVGMDKEAVTTWLAFYNDTEARQGPDGDLKALGAFASRAGELAARVAAVYAAWRCSGGRAEIIVTGEDMRRAVALVGYSIAEWQRQGETALLTPTERDARDLLSFLHKKGWDAVARAKIARSGLNSLRKDKGRRNAAIDELIRRRWLTPSGSKLAVAKKPESGNDNANSDNSDNFAPLPDDVPGQSVIKVSEVSVINPSSVFFPMEPPPGQPGQKNPEPGSDNDNPNNSDNFVEIEI